jgi:hypothetical protein
MRASSIRQPYAELILRRIKPIEFRSRQALIIGERLCIVSTHFTTGVRISSLPS